MRSNLMTKLNNEYLDTGQCAVQPCRYPFSLVLLKHILNLCVINVWLQNGHFRNFMNLFRP